MDVYVNECVGWLQRLWQEVLTVNLWATLVSVFYFLTIPDPAFIAIWIMVALDFISRLMAEVMKAGSLLGAFNSRRIESKKARQGIMKVLGYYILCVAANQAACFGSTPGFIIKAIILGYIFMIELISVVENLIDASVKNLNPLLLRFKKERDKLIEGDGAAQPSFMESQPMQSIKQVYDTFDDEQGPLV